MGLSLRLFHSLHRSFPRQLPLPFGGTLPCLVAFRPRLNLIIEAAMAAPFCIYVVSDFFAAVSGFVRGRFPAYDLSPVSILSCGGEMGRGQGRGNHHHYHHALPLYAIAALPSGGIVCECFPVALFRC